MGLLFFLFKKGFFKKVGIGLYYQDSFFSFVKVNANQLSQEENDPSQEIIAT